MSHPQTILALIGASPGRLFSHCLFAFILLSFLSIPSLHAGPLITKEQIQHLSKSHDESAKRRLLAWKRIMDRYQFHPEDKKLRVVNDFFNQMRYVSDLNYKGVPDHWMTPIEFLLEGGGDCEDYSIAKYFTLIALGVPSVKLRITYVKAINLNQAHMVLSYYPALGEEPLILDNLISKIKKASERRDLVPVYSFNGESLWFAKARVQNKPVAKSSRIKIWRSLQERMQQEQRAQ